MGDQIPFATIYVGSGLLILFVVILVRSRCVARARKRTPAVNDHGVQRAADDLEQFLQQKSKLGASQETENVTPRVIANELEGQTNRFEIGHGDHDLCVPNGPRELRGLEHCSEMIA